jgi:endonuclease/exonuclease/phosphatase family metal-dependent hydrolase
MKKLMITRAFFVLFTMLTSSSIFAHGSAAKTVTVMSYNLENLFDTTHDAGKNDYTYLPLALKNSSTEVQTYCKNMRSGYYRRMCFELDWNEAILNKKISQLSRVIKSVSPDILVVQEVENLKVLTQLRDQGLALEGYKHIVLIDGPDRRGIDIGILSRFPLANSAKLHYVNLSDAYPDRDPQDIRPTRGILEATFQIGKRKLTVLGNHWPSQNNPDAARLAAAKRMAKIAANGLYPVIALGDFNTVASDSPNAIKEQVTIDDRFFDAQEMAWGRDLGNTGSHFYRGHWSPLDRLFFYRKGARRGCSWIFFSDCIRPQWPSFGIVKKDWMLTDQTFTDQNTGDEVTYKGVPLRFNAKTGEGFSDHLPVILKVIVE